MEMEAIIRGEHKDPHHILGMHEIEIQGKNQLIVNAFIPQGKEIIVLDVKEPKKKYKMERIHEEGFFTVLISTRSKWFQYQLKIKDFTERKWVTYDPYSFMPVLTDLDLYLFGEGTHYRIYEKLGAHPMEIQGVEGVLFAVWAPNAKRVSVVGDFNGWDGRRHGMRILGDSGIWELFIPGLQTYDKYKYEIKTQDEQLLLKADPYGFYHEHRPQTASIVFALSSYDWQDEKWLKKRRENHLLNRPISIYEVHLGSWKRKVEEENRCLTYRELAHELVLYVQEMGYTHIELMPIAEHPFDDSWGYQVTGYYAPTSRFGTPKDFKYFIDYCHQNDIGVIVDWVPAHFPKDAHGLIQFDGTALYEHADSRLGEHPHWGTLIFNYGRHEVKNFLLANALFWLNEYHVDGLRVDAVASMLYLDYGRSEGEWIPNCFGGNENIEAVAFFKHLNSIVHQQFPGILMIAEESTAWPNVSRPTDIGGLGFGFKWNMGWMNDVLRYFQKDPIHRKYHHHDVTFGLVYAFTENFILPFSHDEVVHGKGSMIGKMPGDHWKKFANLRALYGFMFAHPGKKLLFMGNDIGQFEEWKANQSIDWHLLEYDYHRQLQKYMQHLNHFYQTEQSLWKDDFTPEGFEWINYTDAQSSILSFIRKDPQTGEFIVIICNFTPMPHEYYRVGVPEEGVYREVFNSDDLQYGGSGVKNENKMKAEEREWDGRRYSIPLRLPPLSTLMLKKD